MRESLTLLALVAALGGCAEDRIEPTPTADGGEAAATPAALAWVAAQHVGQPHSARSERDFAEELGNGAVGTELRFRSGSQDDGDLLVVAVGNKNPDGLRCTPDHETGGGGCVTTDRGTLIWEDAAPEEDPGNVGVAITKGDVTVLVFQSGPAITRDPRELDLRISVEEMFGIAADPRTDLITSERAVVEGEDLPYWDG